MGGSVQLPEFADLGALPSAHRSVKALRGSRMGAAILHGPAADLGAVEFEGVQAQGFRGGEAVGARRGASQTFSEEIGDRLRPGGGVVASRGSRHPYRLLLACARKKVIGGERIKTTAGQAKLLGRLGSSQGVPPEGIHHMADEGRRVAIGQL